jgi:hypothetical protein
MPDAITPVGTMYPQQSPIAALSSIYGIQQQQLGIKQAQQNLQTGQYTQQSAQANAQQDQQKASELQAVGNLTKQAYSSGRYKDADGNFDNQKFADDVAQVAPTYGQGIAKDATMRAGELYKNQQTLTNLTGEQRAPIANAFGAWAADPNFDHSKMTDAIENLRDQYKNVPGMSRLLTSMSSALPNQDGPQFRQALTTAARMVNAPSSALTTPQGVTNAAGQIQNRMPGTGALSAPQLGPGATNPASPQVAGQTSAATLPYVGPAAAAAAGGSSRAGGAGNADILASNNVVAGQKDARTNIDLTTRIDQLADIVAPGALPAKVSAGLGALGLQDVTQARTELQKDLGRLRGPLADRAASDGRAGELLAGLPTDTTPTQTIHQAMDVQRGAAKQDLALGALRDKTAAATGGNMNGFQSQYSHAVGVASPLMHEYWSLPKGDQAAFLKRNSSSPQQAQDLRNRFEAARSQLNVGQ